MGVTLTKVDLPIMFVLRGNGSEHQKFGDPYTWAADVQDYGDGVAYISAMRGKPSLGYDTRQEIRKLLMEQGFSKIAWSRSKETDRRQVDRRKSVRKMIYCSHELDEFSQGMTQSEMW